MTQKVSAVTDRLGLGPLNAVNLFTVVLLLFLSCLGLAFVPRTGPAVLFPAYFLAAAGLATAFNRTLPLRWTVFCFMWGAITLQLVNILVTWPFDKLFGTDSLFLGSAIIPVLEETLKIVPVLVLLLQRRWRFRWTAGAIDLMMLGAAVGAGFAFFEDTLLSYAPAGVLPGSAAQFIMESHRATPHWGPFYLFPSMDVGLADSAYIGHTAATAFVGLMLGLGRMLAGRFRRLGAGLVGKIIWLLPLAAWLWVTVDHGFFNFIADRGGLSGLADGLYNIGARGRLSSYAFYLLALATMAFEWWIVGRNRARMEPLALDRNRLKLLRAPLHGILDYAEQLSRLRVYLRERRGVAYGLHYLDAAPDPAARQERQRAGYLRALIAVLVGWKGDLEMAPVSDASKGEHAPTA